MRLYVIYKDNVYRIKHIFQTSLTEYWSGFWKVIETLMLSSLNYIITMIKNRKGISLFLVIILALSIIEFSVTSAAVIPVENVTDNNIGNNKTSLNITSPFNETNYKY
jgi:hypothetical protein